MNCSPKQNRDRGSDPTCLSLDILKDIAKSYNAHQASINSSDRVPETGTKMVIWTEIQKRLDSECGQQESCWLEQKWIPADVSSKAKGHFRTKQPVEWIKNKNEWLSNIDIQEVMRQYHEVSPTFHFIGVFPIDFDSVIMGKCVSEALCKINVAALHRKGVKQLGVIFNMDRHDQSGSHWVAVFANWDMTQSNYGVYYYDSNALKPPKQIVAFMKRLCDQTNALPGFKHFPSDYNKKRHQFKNTECGIFSMFFLIRCMKGDTLQQISNYRYRDNEIQVLRSILFTPQNHK